MDDDEEGALAIHSHPREALRMMQRLPDGRIEPFREFTFRVDGLTGEVQFEHGLVVCCADCGRGLDPDSSMAREAVSFFLANRPAAKLARVVGHGLGISGTRRPALGAERRDDR